MKERESSDLTTTSSDQILASFISHDGIRHEFKVTGRGTSVLGSAQGDHVTAYGLIKRGVMRSFQGVTIEKVEDLEQIRARRDQKLFPYLSEILAIDPDFKEEFVEDLKKIMDSYNNRRFKKEELNLLKGELGQQNEVINTALENTIEKAYMGNCYYMCSEIEEITRSLLTHYNHVPATAFPKDPNMPDDSKEGPALDRLDRVADVSLEIKNLQREIDSQILRIDNPPTTPRKGRRPQRFLQSQLQVNQDRVSELLQGQISDIKELFFYPKISDEENEINLEIIGSEESLVQWCQDHKLSQLAKPRTNDLDTLNFVVARHLFITFAAYPELKDNKDKITEGFLNLVANEWSMSLPEKESFKAGVSADIDEELNGCVTNLLQDQEINSRRSSEDKGSETEQRSAIEIQRIARGYFTRKHLEEKQNISNKTGERQ